MSSLSGDQGAAAAPWFLPVVVAVPIAIVALLAALAIALLARKRRSAARNAPPAQHSDVSDVTPDMRSAQYDDVSVVMRQPMSSHYESVTDPLG